MGYSPPLVMNPSGGHQNVGKRAVGILLECFLVAPCILILSADPGTEAMDTWNRAKYLFVDKCAYCTIPSIDMESTF